MDSKVLIIITIALAISIIAITTVIITKKRTYQKYKNHIVKLDTEKNQIATAPVISELVKIETIIKNDKMEEKYKSWKEEFEEIKTSWIPKIEDMISELDIYIVEKDYKSYNEHLPDTELEINKAKTFVNKILDEIREINSSEEKYRSIITKLKARYRELKRIFETRKAEYADIADIISLQFENIEKRFHTFEIAMDKNEYTEVIHIVKAIDTMVDHITIVIDEVPDLILLATKLIPKRIEQITEVYEEMKTRRYPMGFMNIEYNIQESLKNVNQIIDRIKVLNLEDCMFELKTMLEYLDSLFKEFENEKQSRKLYEESYPQFEIKLEKINNIVLDVYNQLDDIKNMYDLDDNDIKVIDDINTRLESINKDYVLNKKALSTLDIPYSKMTRKLEELSNELKKLEDDLDISLKSLGNMYDDELRAREQLDEIQDLLNHSKTHIRSYKLPIISDNYFVELSEASEAILEIIKELERKPISIKTLNTRVDTARDLVLKLYNTTNEMIGTAKKAEEAIVYGNRYKSTDEDILRGLTQAETLFFKGNYKSSCELALNTLDLIDTSIRNRLNYESNK